MPMKPYLITMTNYLPGVDRYLRSLANLQDLVVLVVVDFMPHLPDISKIPISEVIHIKHETHFPGWMGRWKYLPALDPTRWWIFTDTSDVIFQGPIPDPEQFGSNILVSSEGLIHGVSKVWMPIMKQAEPHFDKLEPLLMHCFGTWAMKGHWGRELMNFIAAQVQECARWPLGVRNQYDQLFYNLWLMNKEFKEAPSLFGTLAHDYYLKKITKDDQGRFWKNGIMPAIIHANGATKEFLPD